MKRLLYLVLMAPIILTGCYNKHVIEAPINAVNSSGEGDQIGSIKAYDARSGLKLKITAQGIPQGVHGVHVHQNPSCQSAPGPDGKLAAAMAAGGHYDPQHTGKHLGPRGAGHMGDLPPLNANANGDIKMTITAPRLTTADLKGRSIIIHAGADNYSDVPDPLGGGGARIACAVIK